MRTARYKRAHSNNSSMKIIYLNPSKLEEVAAAAREAAKFLREGKIIIYPTDTIYGIGCDAQNNKAVEKIFRIKKREKNKPLSVIVENIEAINRITFFSVKTRKILEKFLPGPYTFILPGARNISRVLLAGGLNIGVRIPDSRVTQKIAEEFDGPVVTTSVNISGSEVLNDPFQMAEFFSRKREAPDLILDAGKSENFEPSMIIDLTRKHPQILRSGNRTAREVLELLDKLKEF